MTTHDSSNYQYLTLEGTDLVRVTLNRPEVRNAFNEGLIGELHEVFTKLGADDRCRIIVLQSVG